MVENGAFGQDGAKHGDVKVGIVGHDGRRRRGAQTRLSRIVESWTSNPHGHPPLPQLHHGYPRAFPLQTTTKQSATRQQDMETPR